MPADKQSVPLAQTAIEYAVKLFVTGVCGYVVYDFGRIYGWWAYPTPQELLDEVDCRTKKLEDYQELIAQFTATEDDTKEDALRIMASNASFVTSMASCLFYMQKLIKKIDGRLQSMRSVQENRDDAMIAQLEHHAAMLHVQADIMERIIAFSKQHAAYFKLYSLEQKVAGMCARELQLYELFKDDATRLQTELLNYSSYAHVFRFGLITFVRTLQNLRGECVSALARYARPYPQMQQLLDERAVALYQIEHAITATKQYTDLADKYEKLSELRDEDRYDIRYNI
jgi:hypothetical protein